MTENEDGYIEIYGAREHNLKNIDLKDSAEQVGCIYWLEWKW